MRKPEDTPGITWMGSSRRYQLRLFDKGQVVYNRYFSVHAWGSKTAAGKAAMDARTEQAGRLLHGEDLSHDRLTVVALLDQYVAAKQDWDTHAQLVTRANHLREHLGCKTVRNFHDTDVAEIQASLRVKFSPKQVGHVMSCLRGALARAVDLGLTARNVALRVKLPKVPRRRERYTASEVDDLLAAAGTTWLGVALLFLADCALRPGELAALRWADISADWTDVHISRSRQNLVSTKTYAGDRFCPLTPRLRVALKQWKLVRPSRDWIFPALSDAHKPITVQTFDKKFDCLLTKAGVRRRRPYDLRHTAITVAVTYAASAADPQNLQDVARWAGHKDVRTTLLIYTEAMGGKTAMADVMEHGWRDQAATRDEVA